MEQLTRKQVRKERNYECITHHDSRSSFLQVILRVKRFVSSYFQSELKRVWGFLDVRRLCENLSQAEFAKKLEVKSRALLIREWDKNISFTLCWPKIVNFFGDDFLREVKIFVQKLLWWIRERRVGLQEAVKCFWSQSNRVVCVGSRAAAISF